MNLKVLFILLIYWSCWSLLLLVGATDDSNIFSGDYNVSADINASGFDDDELDSGGFFSGVIGVFTAVTRFIGLVFFGFTTVLTGVPQILFASWQTLITMLTIGFIIDSLWSG